MGVQSVAGSPSIKSISIAGNVLKTKARCSETRNSNGSSANLALAITASLALSSCQTRHAQDNEPRPAVEQNPAQPQITPAPAAPNPVPPQAVPPASAPAPSSITPSPAAPAARPAPVPSSSATTAPPKVSAPPIALKPNPAIVTAAISAPKPAQLDLNSLEKRLKDTRAIGVFTKLSLKNQVDDLLSELREYHKGSSKMQLPVLRQQFDLLILKVLSLLQDGDPQLATAIVSSREAIWGILMDPEKFAKI
jgi:hypothetical protein